VNQKGKTVLRADWGRFYDRNLLSAAAQVPEKGGIFTRSAFDVALPRLGVDYTDSLIDLVITSGFPTGPGTRGPAENPAYRQFAEDLRSNPLALYQLLGIPVPTRSPSSGYGRQHPGAERLWRRRQSISGNELSGTD
jgi:hypothetical protein